MKTSFLEWVRKNEEALAPHRFVATGTTGEMFNENLPHLDIAPPKVFIADKGCDSNHICETIVSEGGTPVIPARANRKEPEPTD